MFKNVSVFYVLNANSSQRSSVPVHYLADPRVMVFIEHRRLVQVDGTD